MNNDYLSMRPMEIRAISCEESPDAKKNQTYRKFNRRASRKNLVFFVLIYFLVLCAVVIWLL